MESDHHTIVTSSSAPNTVTTVAPFHYLINEQAKSIAALQELQNEVTALLEFRDLVMDTFPHLRTKSEVSPAMVRPGKRDWEPGIRVRRKLRDPDTSLAAAPRSRSNSHGKAPGNSGSSTGSSAVQDSGFCTESKEHCSSTTTSGGESKELRKTEQEAEAEDELWTLLELIHHKGTRLRLEVEQLQDKNDLQLVDRRAKSLEDLRPTTPRTKCDTMYQVLRSERDLLLDRVTEMEAENLANLAQTNQLLAEIGALSAEKRDLEDQLRLAIHTKTELNSRIHDLHTQFVSRSNLVTSVAKNSKISPKLGSSQFIVAGSHFSPAKRSLSNEETVSCPATEDTLTKEFQKHKPREEHPNRLTRTSKELTVLKSADYSDIEDSFKIDSLNKFSTPKSDKVSVISPRLVYSDSANSYKCNKYVNGKLGTLDGIVSSPSNIMKGIKGVTPDKEKTAAILRETNPAELQRHLLTTTFENQVVKHKLRDLFSSQKDLSLQLERTKEENEDLRFKLEERSIELEGTRARVRLLERLQAAKLSGEMTHSHTLPPPSHESTPTPLLPRLTLPHPLSQADHSSSTESAHNDSPRKQQRPPSKIPLKSYSAPKPPSGKTAVKTHSQVTSLNKKERNWDPVTRSMKDTTSRPASRESMSSNRRVRKTSQQDGSFSSTNSTPSMRRDPPSSPASKKIPQRIVSDNDSKVRRQPSEFPDSLNAEVDKTWKHSSSETEYFDSIDNQSSCYQSVRGEGLAECDSLDNTPSDLV